MYETITRIDGAKEGPVSTVLVGVHGNERCGVEALQEILANIHVVAGTVYFAYGNPRAIEENVRFTESDLNRMFKSDKQLTERELQSYEYARAQELKKIFDISDALLDIHASTTPESVPFLICEENGFDIAQKLPFQIITTGFDDVEPGGTDYYMNKTGKIGFAPECGYLADPQSKSIAVDTIMRFLAAQGHIETAEFKAETVGDKKVIRMYQLYITKTNDFKLARNFEDFASIHPGEIIGWDGGVSVTTDRESVILFPNEHIPQGSEAFLLGEVTKEAA